VRFYSPMTTKKFGIVRKVSQANRAAFTKLPFFVFLD
jgi:hypothetical protein